MWLWLLLGWCAAAVGVAALHHRLRRGQSSMPAEVEEFLVRFETELAKCQEAEYLGLLPGQFTGLLRVGGQETPVPLLGLYHQMEAAPERFALLVTQLVDEIRAIGLNRLEDHQFGGVAMSILPQVRSRSWVAEQGAFGDGALLQRPLGSDLAVVYVIDDEHSMVFVCRAHLRQWGCSVEDLHMLALGNLGRLGGAEQLRQMARTDSVLVQTGDGYDAARVLLLEEFEGLLVAMPDRDTLWIGREPGADGVARRPDRQLAALVAAAASMARAAPHPISDRIYRLKNGVPEPVNA